MTIIDVPICTFDLETTDASLDADIIQFAASKQVNDSSKPELLEFLCKPEKPISPDAEKVHGISWEDVEDKYPFRDWIPKVIEFINGCYIGGFNICKFDLPILDAHFNKSGYNDVLDNAYVFDAYPMFIKHMPHSLESAYNFYTGKNLNDAHDAKNDVTASIEVIHKQCNLEEKSISQAALETAKAPTERVGFSNHIYFDDNGVAKFGFGKNKDQPVKENLGYCQWMLKQEFPPQVQNYIKSIL